MQPVKLFTIQMCTFSITVAVSRVLARSEVRILRLMLVCKPWMQMNEESKQSSVRPGFFSLVDMDAKNWILKEIIY